jgi:hypothetical protein
VAQIGRGNHPYIIVILNEYTQKEKCLNISNLSDTGGFAGDAGGKAAPRNGLIAFGAAPYSARLPPIALRQKLHFMAAQRGGKTNYGHNRPLRGGLLRALMQRGFAKKAPRNHHALRWFGRDKRHKGRRRGQGLRCAVAAQ